MFLFDNSVKGLHVCIYVSELRYLWTYCSTESDSPPAILTGVGEFKIRENNYVPKVIQCVTSERQHAKTSNIKARQVQANLYSHNTIVLEDAYTAV